MKTVVNGLVLAGAVGLAAAQSANADIVISFGYNQLAGSFTPGGNNDGTFNAVAANLPNGLQTTGNVNREIPAVGTANFGPGFFGGGGDFVLSLNLTNITNTSANATGNLRIRDTSGIGDIIQANISGTWNLTNPGLPFFSGVMTQVLVVNNSGDGTFDGTGGTNWSMAGLPANPLFGQIQTLFIQFNLPNSFAGAFSNVSTNVQGQIIPAPGALALLAAGGLVAGRRRR